MSPRLVGVSELEVVVPVRARLGAVEEFRPVRILRREVLNEQRETRLAAAVAGLRKR